MADKLLLEDVRFYGQHGLTKAEQTVGAWFSVDAELGLRQAVLAVEPHILEEELVRHQSLTTGFLRIPMDSIRTSTRSPGRSGPTPAGVPVVITSPGSSVITWETRATRSSIGKTISLVLED